MKTHLEKLIERAEVLRSLCGFDCRVYFGKNSMEHSSHVQHRKLRNEILIQIEETRRGMYRDDIWEQDRLEYETWLAPVLEYEKAMGGNNQ